MLQDAFRTGAYAAISYAGSVDEIRAVFEVYLEKLANVLTGNGFTVSSAVLDGSAAETLLAALEPGDLAVMTSHGHGGVKRWLLGSVADKLVRGATVPVLIARGS